MTSDYIEKMQRKENLCRAYIQKADEAYRIVGKHCAEEGRNLQEAIRLQNEMAEISDGEERNFHLRRQKELETRLREVVKEVSPETYLKIVGKTSAKSSKNSNNAASSSSPAAFRPGRRSTGRARTSSTPPCCPRPCFTPRFRRGKMPISTISARIGRCSPGPDTPKP